MPSDYWTRFNGLRASRRRFLGGSAAVGVGAAGLAIVGCGDDDDDDVEETPTSGGATATQPSGGASPTAEPTEEITRGGTFRMPMVGVSSGNPPTLYPFENLTYLAQYPAGYHYSRLLRGVAGKDIAVEDKTVLTGDLAEDWEQIDETTYSFTWKPNVVWHNKSPMNGRAATATDWKASYDTFATVSQNGAKFGGVIESVDAPDEKTVVIKLKTPFAPFLSSMAASAEGPWFIPVETIDSGQAKEDPVGTGPYLFRELATGVSIKWEKNPDYYDAPLPNYDKIEAGLFNDAQRIVAALQSGDFDASLLNGVLYRESAKSLNAGGYEAFVGNVVEGGLYFNFDNAPFQDKRVRQALSMALDRDGYLKVQDGTGRGNWHAHIPVGMAPFYVSPKDPDFGPNAKYYEKNLAESKALLSAAGAEGLAFKLIGNVDRYGPEAQQLWELTTNSLNEAGFQVELVFQEYATYIQSTFLGKMDPGTAAVGPLIGAPNDPDDILVTLYWTKSVRHNWGGTPIEEQAEIDADIEKQRTILDTEERIAFVKDIQRKMAESMLIVPLIGSAGYVYAQPWVKNIFYKSGYTWVADALQNSYFTEERLQKG
jgi:peptide/nickel transport system substrate-binding protein